MVKLVHHVGISDLGLPRPAAAARNLRIHVANHESQQTHRNRSSTVAPGKAAGAAACRNNAATVPAARRGQEYHQHLCALPRERSDYTADDAREALWVAGLSSKSLQIPRAPVPMIRSLPLLQWPNGRWSNNWLCLVRAFGHSTIAAHATVGGLTLQSL
jgi:hypothetical protein